MVSSIFIHPSDIKSSRELLRQKLQAAVNISQARMKNTPVISNDSI